MVMTHIAIERAVHGKNVDRIEKISDGRYLSALPGDHSALLAVTHLALPKRNQSPPLFVP